MPNRLPPRRHTIQFGSSTISFDLVVAERKTLSITVMPDRSVVVTAPKDKEYSVIEDKVRKRAGWILKQQEFFRTFLPLAVPKRFVSGETHCYLGKQFRLKVLKGLDESVKLKGAYFIVKVRDKNDRERIEAVFTNWLRERAKHVFGVSLLRCIERFQKYKLDVPQIRLRKMSNRWGSVGRNGVIYLNPHLVQASKACVDYVITHELCHLLIADHSQRFYALLSKVMPDWHVWKERLTYSHRVLPM